MEEIRKDSLGQKLDDLTWLLHQQAKNINTNVLAFRLLFRSKQNSAEVAHFVKHSHVIVDQRDVDLYEKTIRNDLHELRKAVATGSNVRLNTYRHTRISEIIPRLEKLMRDCILEFVVFF